MTTPRMRTPLSRVLGLGSAHEGTTHFWRQRLTGLANVPLVIGSVILIVALAGQPYETVIATLRSPFVALLLLLMMVSITVHMRIGMQVVIEDYIHGEGAKLAAVIANTFFTIAVGAISVFAILKIAFGG